MKNGDEVSCRNCSFRFYIWFSGPCCNMGLCPFCGCPVGHPDRCLWIANTVASQHCWMDVDTVVRATGFAKPFVSLVLKTLSDENLLRMRSNGEEFYYSTSTEGALLDQEEIEKLYREEKLIR